jgi:dipeptidyl aminopeptidase/acylaminoacyl peptidase
LISTLFFSASGQIAAPAPKRATGFLKRAVTIGTNTHNYRVYVPMGYNPAKKYPVILYLHGGGEWGGDNEKQIGHGLGSVIQLLCGSTRNGSVPSSLSSANPQLLGWR